VVAGITDSKSIVSLQLLVDGSVVYTSSSGPLDAYIKNMTAGAHVLKVTVKDSWGGSFSSSIHITVTSTAGLSQVRHIIFFVQENHTFDNYFGMLGRYRVVSKGLSNNIDGLNLNVALPDTNGHPVKPYHYQTVCTQSMHPAWDDAWPAVDLGKMDLFLNKASSVPNDPTSTRGMGYYDQTDLPYYYELATQFATSDRWFSPVLSQTIPNRMYLFAGTSFGHIDPDSPPTGGWPQKTIFDALDTAGVTWRYYYQDNGSYLPQWSTYQRDASKMVSISNWYTDIQNEATLPSVIFIERAGPTGYDEHPGNNVQKGAKRSATILNALLKSASWASSIYILTYDEGGGQYDHVIPGTAVPPDNIAPMLNTGDYPGDYAHTGFRVPVIVVSPWTRPHYVSHTWRDFTSILRLIEARFNIPPLTARDANADNMMEFFDFSNPAWLTPPPLPPQPITGTCNYQLEKAPGF